MMRLLAFDVETGGLDPKETSLLTAYFQVFDENFNEIDSLSFKVKPDDGKFKVTQKAMDINKINLEYHAEEAMPYYLAAHELEHFLKYNSQNEKLIPVAHNIEFDLSFIYEYLLSKDNWEQYVSYRKLDTAQLANFFKLVGVLNPNQKTNLGDIAKSLNVQFDGAAHSADADTKVAIQVLKKFVELVRK